MAFISSEDFKEAIIRFWQRGFLGYLTKLFKSNAKRTIDTFDNPLPHAHWWLLPQVHNILHSRLNIGQLTHYMQLAIANSENLTAKKNLRILSVGCGNGTQEFLWLPFAAQCFIDAIDITPNNILEAQKMAAAKGAQNINFIISSWEQFAIENKYDIIVFHSSMHHLTNMENVFLKIKNHLNPFGLLVLHEYVGAAKHQFTNEQVNAVNVLLKNTPKHLRKIFKTPFYKSQVKAPGLWRMYLNDPSEAVESDKIRPALLKYTTALFQEELGGNLFVLFLKEMAHNFLITTDENEAILANVFEAEKHFMKNKQSDFIFGIYKFN